MKLHFDALQNLHSCCVNYYNDVYAPLRIRRVTSTSSLYYCCCCRYNVIESSQSIVETYRRVFVLQPAIVLKLCSGQKKDGWTDGRTDGLTDGRVDYYMPPLGGHKNPKNTKIGFF